MTTETKKVSVKELQTFIEAVEFAADTDNWIPSERQWKRIREMINNLESTVAPQPAAAPSYPAPAAPPVYRDPAAPVRLAPGGMPAPQYAAQPQLPPTLANGASSIPVKTPDIDTSNGGYKSTFA